jgi:hypothetical protein
MEVLVDAKRTESWRIQVVLTRWYQLFKDTLLTQQNLVPRYVAETTEVYRERLMGINWFIRLLNKHIARLANSKNNCTGRFWEGRFKSQTLLDEETLATCMVYVDFIPVRTNIVK